MYNKKKIFLGYRMRGNSNFFICLGRRLTFIKAHYIKLFEEWGGFDETPLNIKGIWCYKLFSYLKITSTLLYNVLLGRGYIFFMRIFNICTHLCLLTAYSTTLHGSRNNFRKRAVKAITLFAGARDQAILVCELWIK